MDLEVEPGVSHNNGTQPCGCRFHGFSHRGQVLLGVGFYPVSELTERRGSVVLAGLGHRVKVLPLDLAAREVVTVVRGRSRRGTAGHAAAAAAGSTDRGRLVRGLVRVDDGVHVAGRAEAPFGGVQGGRSVVVAEVSDRVHVVAGAGESVVEVHAVWHQERLLMVEVRRRQNAGKSGGVTWLALGIRDFRHLTIIFIWGSS